MKLTKICLPKLPRSCRQKYVVKAWKEASVDATWSASAAVKKAEQAAVRKQLSDFDRFKVMVLKQRRAHVLSA